METVRQGATSALQGTRGTRSQARGWNDLPPELECVEERQSSTFLEVENYQYCDKQFHNKTLNKRVGRGRCTLECHPAVPTGRSVLSRTTATSQSSDLNYITILPNSNLISAVTQATSQVLCSHCCGGCFSSTLKDSRKDGAVLSTWRGVRKGRNQGGSLDFGFKYQRTVIPSTELRGPGRKAGLRLTSQVSYDDYTAKQMGGLPLGGREAVQVGN